MTTEMKFIVNSQMTLTSVEMLVLTLHKSHHSSQQHPAGTSVISAPNADISSL